MNAHSFSLNWKIAGKAGEGVMVISKILAKACKRHGLHAFNYLEYPSLIKGGHQTGQVFASTSNATCQKRKLDMLVTLGPNGLKFHEDEFTSQTLIIYNANSGPLDRKKYQHLPATIIEMPFTTISKESTGGTMATNMVVLGASAWFLHLDPKVFVKLLADEFGDKGQKIVDMDVTAFEQGYEEAKKLDEADDSVAQFKKLSAIGEVSVNDDDQIILTGNEAVGMAAIASGVQYYSAYPMTPASGLLHYLAAQQENYPLVVKHVEDEISAINQALGASYAGARAMTGSSGGGFALMVEAISFASIAEIPLVILEAQRVGPATGLPTWSAQADLSFVASAGHGDIERVVLTPGTVNEHFELTKLAFVLAEKYQMPVFVLSDKFILESHQTMLKPDLEHAIERYNMISDTELTEDNSYRRYSLEAAKKTGVSPRSIPGQPHGLQLTNSYEHDEFGFATEESEPTRAQVEKRARKMEQVIAEVPEPYLIGPADADVTIVSWGSTINVMLEALHLQEHKVALTGSESDGVIKIDYDSLPTFNAIHIPCAVPLPEKALVKLFDKAKKLVMIEGNQSGQMQKIIRQQTSVEIPTAIRRYDGRPFYAEDLVTWLQTNTFSEEYHINIAPSVTDSGKEGR